MGKTEEKYLPNTLLGRRLCVHSETSKYPFIPDKVGFRMKIPTIDDVNSAAEAIKGKAFRTPLLSNEALVRVSGADVFLKPECLQRTGSFKFRGAYNAISRLSKTELSQGITAASSGNHAQGIAEAAAIFGAPASIVMPSDAPELKVKRTKANGAEVIFYDRASEDRDHAVAKVVNEKGTSFVHPYNNPDVIAGQGTVGLEICEDLSRMGRKPDRVLVCTGGGGLTAGVALAVQHHFPDAIMHSVEPEGFDDYRRSLNTGAIQSNPAQAGSICDAILTPSPGEIGFEINRKFLADGLVITDDEAKNAVRFAYEELKLVTEPGGAAALAALLQAGDKWSGETIVVVISGGNIDPATLSQIIS